MEPTENTSEIIRSIDKLNQRIWNIRGVPLDGISAFDACSEALEKARKINYPFGVAQCLLNLGMGYFIVQNERVISMQYIQEAFELFKQQDNKKWIANTHLTLAIMNNTMVNPEVALYHGLRGITFFENNTEDKHDKIMGYYILGTIYKDLKKYDEAEKYYKTGLADPSQLNGTWEGRIYNGLANIYTYQEKYKEAIDTSLKALAILRSEKNATAESRSLSDIGHVYKKQKKYNEALKYFFEGLAIRENNNVFRFVLTSVMEIASTYREMGENENALVYYKRAEAIALELDIEAKLVNIYQEMALVYKTMSDFPSAITCYEKLHDVSVGIHKKELEVKISNLSNDLLKEKEAEIERIKNVELKAAYDTIEIKNKEILDSINYAKRIQFVLLANEELLKNNLSDHYVFFKPKDIVSGDFYWATKKGDDFYLAICDSTGHGVPGAFMSLLNMSFLNEAINEKNISKPNEVFNHIRKRLISHMDGGRDGMDAILVCLNSKNKTLTYSAANNAPIIIRDNKIVELDFDKMPVGKGETHEEFKEYTITLQSGDNLYLYTDGYADQFGGPKGKKFKYKQLNNILLSVAQKSMKDQSGILEQTFTDWKGKLEQVDDVCIIGVKI